MRRLLLPPRQPTTRKLPLLPLLRQPTRDTVRYEDHLLRRRTIPTWRPRQCQRVPCEGLQGQQPTIPMSVLLPCRIRPTRLYLHLHLHLDLLLFRIRRDLLGALRADRALTARGTLQARFRRASALGTLQERLLKGALARAMVVVHKKALVLAMEGQQRKATALGMAAAIRQDSAWATEAAFRSLLPSPCHTGLIQGLYR